jgi:hypothetical protein
MMTGNASAVGHNITMLRSSFITTSNASVATFHQKEFIAAIGTGT